jgi:glycosyltransferase involved in cell wall biosynthesis
VHDPLIGLSALMIQGGRGGIGKWVEQVCIHLNSAGAPYRIAVFVLRRDAGLFQFMDGQSMLRIHTVSEVFRHPVLNWLWHQLIWPVLALVMGMKLAHVPSYRRMPLWMPCPTVATIHDLAPFFHAGRYDSLRTHFTKWIVPFLARRMDRVIAVSEDTAAAVHNCLEVPADRIHVLHNGHDARQYHPGISSEDIEAARSHLGLGDHYWLYVSRIEYPTKNHCCLIEAFEIFCNNRRDGDRWQMVFAGADWHGSGNVHLRIAGSARHRQIITPGFVQGAYLPGLYAGAAGSVFPSLSEGFGIPIIEAMACGTPVIASGDGATGEVLGEAGVQVNVTNPEAMACAMQMISTDSSFREALIAGGLRRAGDFSWKRSVEGILKIYGELTRQQAEAEPSRGKPIAGIAVKDVG